MEEKVKKLNQQLNDYIVKNNLEDNIFFEYLETIYKLTIQLLTELKEKFENIKNDYDVTQSSLTGINDKITFIKDFYYTNNININVNQLIQDGTINFIETNLGELAFKLSGFCKKIPKKNKWIVDVSNNGLILDLPIAIHELGHFRTFANSNESELNFFFSETIARFDQLQMIDYLRELGYEEEMEYSIKRIYQNAYNIAKYCEPLFKLLLLYKNFSDISQESYDMYYKNIDDYEEKINKTEIRIKKFKYFLDKFAPYIVDIYFSSYLYLKYKENKNFIKNINEFIKTFSQNDINKSLKIIELNNLGSEDQEILFNSIKEMLDTITKEETKDNTRTK